MKEPKPNGTSSTLERSEEQTKPIGRWGRMHMKYLKEYEPDVYNEFLTSGKLYDYLGEINDQAQARMDRIVRQMKAREGVTEELKNRDFMAWLGAVNRIRNQAEEIVLTEMIYA